MRAIKDCAYVPSLTLTKLWELEFRDRLGSRGADVLCMNGIEVQ